ncbi:tyrosine-type recombinase/integrase [Sphingomonas montanisoli]|uniref:Site-specific integrase n=1 Tax=Sphingomonas montanisoli TaxID=2606412 RepID=A0A5D9C2E7_9SPHN|nr:site-specific integrase [Sphingomonas montanisoli]TZG25894.1 site-specific integrase [Sphingomonas montanisoli]
MPTGFITKRSVDAMKPGKADAFLWDAGDGSTKGFGVKLTPAGARSYVFQYRVGGRGAKTKRVLIGKHGAWTPTNAREEAERLSRLVSQGEDPAALKAEKRRVAVDLAFNKYALRFHEACKGAGWRNLVERTLRLHVVPVLADKPLPAITRADVSAVLDRHPATARAQRRNTFAVLRKLFRWANSRGDLGRSPCEGMETPPAVRPRDRVLTDDELRRIWLASANAGKLFGPVVRMLIATGQRREEVTRLDWKELDRARALWTLPADRAKNGEQHTVPLNPLALATLDSLAGKKWPKSGWVFATSGDKPFTAHAKGKTKIDSVLSKDGDGDMPGWRLHDLRRTLATGLQRLGVRFEVTEAILNHVGQSRAGVAGIYQRHTWADEKKAALDAWSQHLTQLLHPPDAGNVVHLAEARA